MMDDDDEGRGITSALEYYNWFCIFSIFIDIIIFVINKIIIIIIIVAIRNNKSL